MNIKHNQADLPTREISSKDLKGSELWWHGPSWLSEDSQFLPKWKFPEIDSEKEYTETTERSKAAVFKIVGMAQENYEMLAPFGMNYGWITMTKLLKVSAYV